MKDIIRLNGFTNVKLAVRVCTALREVLNWRLQRAATFSLIYMQYVKCSNVCVCICVFQ
jgi:hypothetical protein